MYNILALLLLSATGQHDQVDGQAGGPRQTAAPRPFHQINRDLRALLRREALAQTNRERAAAAYEMTVLYHEIRRDPRLPTSDTLKQYKASLWSRLTSIKNELQKKIARERKRSDSQLDGGQDIPLAETTQSLADHLSLVGSTMGGPASVFAQGGGAFGGRVGPPDYGPSLVELIERTIAPEFWDVNGGPGTIVYYRPLHVLVVRATSEVHYRVGGLLDGLRAAGP